MSDTGLAPRRRPVHARPSVLAPTRSLGLVAGLLAVAGLGVAGCAAVAASAASNPNVAAARPNPVASATLAGGTTAAGAPSAASTPAAQVTTGGSGQLVWFAGQDVPTTPSSGTSAVGPRRDDSSPSSALAASGIPVTALLAYRQAAAREAKRRPSCGLRWPLLAGIGRIESNHGRFAGAVLHSDGLSTPPIIGIALNGDGTALILDTDNGKLDGDTVYDHAVGPMQFIPSTWASWGVDANHDGVADPFNIFDAAAAAADYLCAAGRNLRTYSGQVAAVRSYNDSDSYISMVLGVERIYAHGVGISVPIEPTGPDPTSGKHPHHPHLPPVDPGRPPGLPHHPHHPSCAPAGSGGEHDHSVSPPPSQTYEPSGPSAPHRPKHCRPDSGGPSAPGGPSSQTSTTAPPPPSSSIPTTPPVTSSTASDPTDPTDPASTAGDPSSDGSDSSFDLPPDEPSGS